MDFLNKYKSQIDKHKIISFDIFDTLLLRPYTDANDLFKYIELAYSVKNFFKLRLSAEKSARKKLAVDGLEDINIDDIYNFLPEKFSYLKNVELELEKLQTIQNKEMLEVYNYALKNGKTVIIVSDMYLKKDYLQLLLKAKGIEKYDKLFVSSDYKKLKKTGNLFKSVLTEINAAPQTILHIGDNSTSDFTKALECGIDAILYERVFDKFQNTYPLIADIYKNYKSNLMLSSALMLSAIQFQNGENYWKRFGFFYAGLSCISFVFWIYSNMKYDNIRDIVFIARDGYLLEKIFNKLFNNGQYNTYYIYAPRLVNLCLGLDLKNKGKYSVEHNSAVIDYYRTKSNIINTISNQEIIKTKCKILDKYKEELETLKVNETASFAKYLESKHIIGKNIAVVDSVSKFFSSQKILWELLKDKKINGYYYQIQKGAKSKNLNVKSYKKTGRYSKDLKLIEFIMSSPEPPIKSVENNAPVYKQVSENEQTRIDNFKYIEEGCLSFVNNIKEFFPQTSDVLYNCLTPNIISDIMMTLYKNPSQEDKINFKHVLFAYDTQHSKYQELFPKWYKDKPVLLSWVKSLVKSNKCPPPKRCQRNYN